MFVPGPRMGSAGAMPACLAINPAPLVMPCPPQPCPSAAACVVNTTRHNTDNGIIVPQEGHYHSNPFSTVVGSMP